MVPLAIEDLVTTEPVPGQVPASAGAQLLAEAGCGASESTARKTSGRRLGSDALQLCQLLATAVAIDGQIYNDADYQPVGPDARDPSDPPDRRRLSQADPWLRRPVIA